jgi:hypothetical protein
VAEDHGVFQNELADGTVVPVVNLSYISGGLTWVERGGWRYITTAYSCEFDIDNHVVGGLDFGDWSVFEFDFVDAFEDEGEVLRGVLLVDVGHGRIGHSCTFAVSVSVAMLLMWVKG